MTDMLHLLCDVYILLSNHLNQLTSPKDFHTIVLMSFKACLCVSPCQKWLIEIFNECRGKFRKMTHTTVSEKDLKPQQKTVNNADNACLSDNYYFIFSLNLYDP